MYAVFPAPHCTGGSPFEAVNGLFPRSTETQQRIVMVETNVRGSSHMDTLSPEGLNKSLSAARASYKVERWWKYGQPVIDRIEATYNVTDIKQIGSVVSDLASQHSAKLQVNF